MCGIAGIIGEGTPRNRAALASMSAAMVHRGPDGRGRGSRSGRAGLAALLAFRRLAILDLSPAGAQPMVDPATGHVIAFNGEIYNYVELRERLAATGEAFASTGDTAVLLRALGRHGPDAVRWARGMFAVALWDPAARRLLLARDPLGMKPLYLTRNPDPRGPWAVAFASEVRALLASGLLGTPRLDPRAAASVAWSGFVVGPGTAVEGVELLWPGQALELDGGGRVLRAETFWSIPRLAPGQEVEEEELGRVLEEDIRLHLASDVPVAVFLSGGVDSSAVANLAQRAAPEPDPHVHARLRGAGAQRGPGGAPDCSRDRAATTRRSSSPRPTSSHGSTPPWTASTSPPSTGSTRGTCPTPFAAPASRSPSRGPAATSCSAGTRT